jgi:hypothetical protein
MLSLLSRNFLLCLSIAAPAAAQLQPATTTIAPPLGWRSLSSQHGVVEFETAPSDSGLARIIIEPPRALRGRRVDAALEEWLSTGLARQLDMSFENSISIGTTVHGQPAAWYTGTPDIGDTRYEMKVIAVAIKHRDDTFTPVLFLSRGDLQQYDLARSFGQWLPDAPLRGEAGSRAWSPLSPPAPAPFEGLWWGTQLRNQLNLYGGMDLIADRGYIALYRSGFAYRDLPPRGMVEVPDPAVLCKGNQRTSCGTYRVTPDSLIFSWFAEEGLVEYDAVPRPDRGPTLGGFVHNGKQMARLNALPAGFRLDGEYTTTFAQSGPAGSIATSTSITFHPDGRYSSTGFVGFSGGGDLAGDRSPTVAGTSTRGVTTGTYEIRGFQLMLRPQQGPQRLATIVIESPEERPISAVFIDDSYYRR